MSEINAVIFDMDGTLIDSEFLAKKFWRSALESFDLIVEETFLDSMLGRSQGAVQKSIEELYGSAHSYESIKEIKLKEEFAYYDVSPLPLKEGAVDILTFIKAKLSLPIALATSTERYRTDIRLKMGELESYFSYTICGDEVAAPKPDPEMYLKACSMLGVSPQATIVFEDSPSGVEAALEAGTKVIWVKDIIEIPELLRKRVWREHTSLVNAKKELVL